MQFHEHSLVTVIFWGRKIVTEGWPTADDICVSYSCVLGLQIYEFFLNSRLARLTFSNEKRKKNTKFCVRMVVQLLRPIFDQSFGIFRDTCENRWMFVCRAMICYGTSRFCRLRNFDKSCKFSFFEIHCSN